jgi:ABC-type amino acid transport substrate-binding protein
MGTPATSYIDRCRGARPAFCLAALAAAALCALGAHANSAERILSGCEVDYPPFCLVKEDGQADGFSVALMREGGFRVSPEITK